MSDTTRIALILVATALGAFVLSLVPLPGVDRPVLQSLGHPAAVPLALPALLLFGGLATWDPAPSVRRLWPALFVGAAALHGWTHAAALEQLTFGYDPLVHRAGLAFRLQTVASTVGLSAVLWLLAWWAESTGRVRGVLWVTGVLTLPTLLRQIPFATAAWALGEAVPVELVAAVAATSAAAAVYGATSPSADRLRSAWDAMFLPPALVVGIGSIGGPGGADPWIEAASAAVGLIAVIAFVSQGERTKPSVPALIGAALVPLVAVGFAALGIVADPLARFRMLAPGPFDGEVDATVVLAASDPGRHDPDVLAQRLEHLGIDHTMSLSGDEVTVELRDVRGVPPVLDAVLPRNTLVFRGPGLALDRTAIASARVIFSPHDRRPQVRVELTPAGRETFGAWTTTHVGETLSIVLDDEVVSSPRVMGPILGGTAHVDPGSEGDPLAEAEALAAALSVPPLQGTWTVVEQR